ncbi:MAG: RDD family protein [Actinomycetota bacterium]|nr:RDD family protein [Actinomycetota bacterium]
MSRGTVPAVGPDPAAVPGVGQIAEVGRRLSADLIDFLVLAILGAAVGFLLEALGAGAVVSPGSEGGGTRLGLAALPPTLLTLAIHLGYWTLMEGSRGQSVGKMAFGIRAVREDASALDYMTALKRHVLFYIPQVLAWVPSFALLILAATAQVALVLAGVITYMTDAPLRQGFHDKFAGTLVVKA